MSGPLETVRQAWGETPPDWIVALAEACAETSQNAVAARLSRSASLVSTVLRGSYRGDMAAVEERVRGVLMRSVVDCPEIGTVPAQACQDWRARAREWTGVNAMRVRMFRACRICPRNRKEAKDAD